MVNARVEMIPKTIVAVLLTFMSCVNAEMSVYSGWRTASSACPIQPPNLTAYGLQVRRGRDITLFNTTESLANSGHAFRFRNGAINVLVRYGANESNAVRSTDDGLTWVTLPSQPAPFGRRSVSEVRTTALQLKDGDVIWFSGFTPASRNGVFQRRADGSTQVELMRSKDEGLSQISESASLWLPEGMPLINLQHANMVELPSGTLVAIDYAHWEGFDGIGPGIANKTRAFVMQSSDGGANWYYLSTVAYDPTNSTECLFESDTQGTPSCTTVEGFTEAWLQLVPWPRAPDGVALVVLMRTAGSQTVPPFQESIAGPLHRSISVDGGLTWGISQAVADRGVTPNAVITQDGVMVVSYGRPGNLMMFSTNGGASFFGHWCYQAEGASAYDGDAYDSIVHVPNTMGTSEVMVTHSSCTDGYTCTCTASFFEILKNGSA